MFRNTSQLLIPVHDNATVNDALLRATITITTMAIPHGIRAVPTEGTRVVFLQKITTQHGAVR